MGSGRRHNPPTKSGGKTYRKIFQTSGIGIGNSEGNNFKSELNQEINGRLKEYNSRNVDLVNQHIDTIKRALSTDIEGSVETRFGGSVSKHTYVNGLSDHDMLVFLNKSDLGGKTPKEVFLYFKERLQQRLPNSEIKAGNLAVTVKFKSSDIEIQLLPSIKTPLGMRIADPNTGKWSNVIHPDKFASELTSVNQQNNGKVVPAIKIVKPIIATLPRNQQISGYHIEALATEAFKNYNGPKTEECMVQWFFKQASRRILYPVKEKTGQNEYIDDEKLGGRNSPSRNKVSKAFEDMDYRMEQANKSQSIKEWRRVLDGK